MKGNVLELAVAVIIAGAFGLVVTSFTNDILMPPIGMAMGDTDFSEMKHVMQAEKAAVMDSAGNEVTAAVPEIAIRYGQWFKNVLDFLIIAFVLFMIIRSYNRANPPEPEPEPGPTAEDLLTEIRDSLRNRA